MLTEKDTNTQNLTGQTAVQDLKDKKYTESDLVKKLTQNGIKFICEEDYSQNHDSVKREIICQIIQVKHFQTEEDKKSIKTRLQISDGSSYIIAMVKSSVYDKQPDIYNEFAIIQLKGFIINKVKNRNVMIFTLPPKLIYAAGYMRIGNPIPYELRVKKGDFEEDFTPLIPYQAVKSHIDSLIKCEKFVVSHEEKGEEEKENIENLYSVIQKNDSSKIIKDEYYTPIKCLTTFTYDWKIKARVLKKSEIKRWRNPRGSGQLMNIELIDSDCTQILATFFNDAVDKFDHQILENNVYIFTNGTVKIANKKFTSIKNDFSLIFDRNARIDKAEDDSNIDTQGFHFFNIKQIEELKEITTIDFIGVVHYVGPITMINLKNGKQKERRNIIMTDDSGLTVNLCFWGDQAAISDYSDHPVLALKSVRVSDYSGRSLNSSEDCTILLNPEIERAHKLRKWYEKLENCDDLKCISFDASKICKDTTKNNERLLSEVPQYLNIQFMRDEERPLFIMANCFIHYIKNDEKSIYNACPEETCRRKAVFIETSNKWRCEKCNQEYDKCVPTYVLQVKLGDFSGDLYVHFYRDLAKAIMDIDPEELIKLKNDGFTHEYNEVFLRNGFKSIKLLIKIKMYRAPTGEIKINYHASRVLEHSYAHENEILLDRLERYQDKPDIVFEDDNTKIEKVIQKAEQKIDLKVQLPIIKDSDNIKDMFMQKDEDTISDCIASYDFPIKYECNSES